MENNYKSSHSYTEKIDFINDCYNAAELDFANYWTNRTVPEEVLRGVHLRKAKIVKSSELKECDILNLQLPKERLCGDNHLYTSVIHKRRHLSQANTSPGSPRSTSPSLRTSSPCAKTIRCASSPKSSHKCSMRIAALAEPAKRQCIDTWRNKFDVLPGFMINRLKQQVLDEKPLVHIPQAINCFKKRKLPSTDYMSSKKLSPSEIKKNRHMEEIRNLCALFGKKIAQRLKTPAVEVDLNSHIQSSNVVDTEVITPPHNTSNVDLILQLKNILRVVTLEISTLLKSQNKINMDNNRNKLMLDEVSRMVTLWIATVLEDSSYKQLEDDLRVRKTLNEIVPKRKNFELITLIQKMLNQEIESTATELEEEEGPVLDIIDNMLDKVFNICETQINNQDEVKEQKSNITLDTTENNQFDMSTTAQTYTSEYDTGESDMTIDKSIERDVLLQNRESSHVAETPQHSDTQVSVNKLDNILTDAAITNNIKDDLRNQIKNLIDNFESNTNLKHEEVSTDQPTDVKILIREDDIELTLNPRDDHTNINIDNLQQNVAEYLTDTKNDIIDVNDASKEEELLENDFSSNNLDDTNTRLESVKTEDQHLDEKDQNIMYEADAETIDDLISDEQYKKVKFSTTDIDLQLKSSANTTSPNTKNVGDDNRQSTGHIKPAQLLTPNKNLLSIADESWPEDVEMSSVKALQSVSKSVMSLGNILEAQESKPTSPTNDDIKQSAKDMLNMLNEQIAKSQADNFKNVHEYIDTIPILSKRNSDKIINQFTDSMSKEVSDAKYIEFKNTADMVEEHIVLVTDIDGTTSSESKIIEADNVSRQLHSSKAKHSFGDRLNVGTGDQMDTKNKNNIIYDAVMRKLNQPSVKFDYKVRPSTAPSWVARGHGEPSEDSHHNLKIRTTHKRKECNIRQWCKNMESIVEDIEMWNKWIDYTCKSVIQKERKNKITSDSRKKVTTDWVNLKRDIDMDAVFWGKFKRRAVKYAKYELKSKHFFIELRHQESILQDDKKTITKSHLVSKEIVERIEDIEKIFSWMHRLVFMFYFVM